jgi:hypothetical protein
MVLVTVSSFVIIVSGILNDILSFMIDKYIRGQSAESE